MIQAPPLRDWRLFPVTTGVGLVAVAVSAWWWWGGGDVGRLTMDMRAFGDEPWRLISSIFPHANAIHLLFNLYWLWYFGCVLERQFGSAAMLGMVVLLGTGSMVAEYALFDGGKGLSGVGYGLFGISWVLSASDHRFAGVVDRRLVEFFVFWFFLCIVMTVTEVLPVANVAHGWGALLGVLLGWAYVAGSSGARWARTLLLVGVLAATAVAGSVARPYVNFGSRRGDELTDVADEALKRGQPQRAVELYHEAIAVDGGNYRCWHNLGVALFRLNELDEGVAAFQKAHELVPRDEKTRGALAWGLGAQAARAGRLGNWDQAADLYRQATQLDPSRPELWYGLGEALHSAERPGEAEKALERAAELGEDPGHRELLERVHPARPPAEGATPDS